MKLWGESEEYDIQQRGQTEDALIVHALFHWTTETALQMMINHFF